MESSALSLLDGGGWGDWGMDGSRTQEEEDFMTWKMALHLDEQQHFTVITTTRTLNQVSTATLTRRDNTAIHTSATSKPSQVNVY